MATSLAPGSAPSPARRQTATREAPALPDVRQRGVLRLARLRALPHRPGRRRSARTARSASRRRRPTNPCINRTDWGCNWRAVGPAGAALPELRARRRRRPRRRRTDDPVPVGPAPGALPAQRARRAVGSRARALRFAYRSTSAGDAAVIGHRSGEITLDLDEADPARREEIRATLGEHYRTPLGHIRHELGHFVWLDLVASDARPARRSSGSLFGDERVDYVAALDDHYARVDDGSWRDAPRVVLRLGPPVGGLRRVVGAADARPRRRRDRGLVGRRPAPPPTPPTPRRGWPRRSRPASPPTSSPGRWACATSTRSPSPPACGPRSSSAGAWCTSTLSESPRSADSARSAVSPGGGRPATRRSGRGSSRIPRRFPPGYESRPDGDTHPSR